MTSSVPSGRPKEPAYGLGTFLNSPGQERTATQGGQGAQRTGASAASNLPGSRPSAALPEVQALDRQVRAHGLGGILALGRPHQPLLGVPVPEGYAGLVLPGGLNPVAAAREAGVEVTLRSFACLTDFGALTRYEETEAAFAAERAELQAEMSARYG